MSVRNNSSIQHNALPAANVPAQDSLEPSPQSAPIVASRVELLPAEIKGLILQFIAGHGVPLEVGERIHKCILSWRFTCRQGATWFNEKALNKDQQSALSLYRTPLILKWRAAELAKVELASLEMLLKSSTCIDTRYWDEKLTTLLLDTQFQNFSCEEIAIDLCNAGSLRGSHEKLCGFLSLHKKLADRPAIRVIQEESLTLPQHFVAMAEALQRYKKGTLDLRIFVMSSGSSVHDNPENLAALLADAAKTGVIRKLCIEFQLDEETPQCLALFVSALSNCTSLEMLFLRLPGTEYTPVLLNHAKGNRGLRHLRLELSSGALTHFNTLPAFLQHFPKLALLELRTLWEASSEEMAALKKAVAEQFPKMEVNFYNDIVEL